MLQYGLVNLILLNPLENRESSCNHPGRQGVEISFFRCEMKNQHFSRRTAPTFNTPGGMEASEHRTDVFV